MRRVTTTSYAELSLSHDHVFHCSLACDALSLGCDRRAPRSPPLRAPPGEVLEEAQEHRDADGAHDHGLVHRRALEGPERGRAAWVGLVEG